MYIYVGNLSMDTTLDSLKSLFGGLGKRAGFDLKKIKTAKGNIVFAIVSMPTERLAKKAIKRLNMKLCDGKHVVVRQYSHRVTQNDRRALNWRTKSWIAKERRILERRGNQAIRKTAVDVEIFTDHSDSAA